MLQIVVMKMEEMKMEKMKMKKKMKKEKRKEEKFLSRGVAALAIKRETDCSDLDAALSIIDGRDDWVRIRGIDRWLGGIHLQGVEAAWRWDAETGRVFHT